MSILVFIIKDHDDLLKIGNSNKRILNTNSGTCRMIDETDIFITDFF